MTSFEFKALKSRRASIKAQCTRTKNAVDAIDPREIDVIYIKQRKERFAEYWNQYNEIQFKIYELLDTTADITNAAELKAEQDRDAENFEQEYFSITTKMEHLILDGQSAVDTSNNAQTVLVESNARDISQVHLPKISIPRFNGNYENWYPFYNTFESMIHSNTRLTNIQKFHYLISSLEGDATHVIQSLEINSDNYQEALDLLKQRYDDKRIITQEHIKALFDLTPVAKGNHIALRKLIDDVMRHLRSLKGLNRPTEQWDDLIIYLITTKLDTNTIKDWEDNVQRENMPTLKEMIDFLVHKCKALSAISKRNPNESSVSNLRKPNKAIGAHVTTIFSVFCARASIIYFNVQIF